MMESSKIEKQDVLTANGNIINFRGERFITEGVLSDDKTLIAISLAKPGKAVYSSKSQDNSGLPSRTNAYGDVTVYTWDNNNMIQGTLVMPTRSWMIMQSKDNNGERSPFIRSCWTVKTQVIGDSGGFQPPVFSTEIQNLTMKAILHSTYKLLDEVRNNQSNISNEFSELADVSVKIAKEILKRKNNRITENSTQVNKIPKIEVSKETLTTINDILKD